MFLAREDGRVVAGDGTSSGTGEQSKSMFLATVSHELRTPLYGLSVTWIFCKPKSYRKASIVCDGNEQLFQPVVENYQRYSRFSKIESEQLKIEPREFSPRE